MTIYQLSDRLIFPPPEHAEPEGVLAVGGDLSLDRLLLAYTQGIFPWYCDGDPIIWWSPSPRLIMYPQDFKISKSLKRTLKKQKFEVRFDSNFEKVISSCSHISRKGQDGTWITKEMKQAYMNLYIKGFAHSIETYLENKIVGGLYGVFIGNCFFGESMFAKVSDASKVAFSYLVALAKILEFDFIDCQVTTKHLQSLGAVEITREMFLTQLKKALFKSSRIGSWKEHISLINWT